MNGHIKPNDWLKLAEDEERRDRIKNDPILPLYKIIIKQFESWNPIKWEDAIVGLHIVYGWMPTIPKFEILAKLTDQQSQTVKLLKEAKLRILKPNEIDELRNNLVNKSVVGTSKFLHLLAPKKFAIWDKHVATAWFGQKHSYNYYNSSEKYLAYIETLKNWLTEKQISSPTTFEHSKII